MDRLLLGLPVILALNIDHFKVNTAFLNGDLHEEVFVRQPEGWVKKGEEKILSRLKWAIYDLKQASRVGTKKLMTFYSHYISNVLR